MQVLAEITKTKGNMDHILSCCYLLYFVCATAQRETGETALNEASSRSHQILRLVGAPLIRSGLDYL